MGYSSLRKYIVKKCKSVHRRGEWIGGFKNVFQLMNICTKTIWTLSFLWKHLMWIKIDNIQYMWLQNLEMLNENTYTRVISKHNAWNIN